MNPFNTLDDGFHLLRRLPVSGWLFHLAGGLPFLLALLWSATETGILYTPEKGLLNSLVCALAFVWMQFWRAQFAAKLEELLQPENAERWSLQRAARCFCIQAGFQSARILIVPLAALLTFPYASVVAYFQSVTVFSTRQDISLRDLSRRAARVSVPNQKQLWLVLALLGAIATVIFLNLVVLYVALPTLVKSLTGVENQFTRGTGQVLTWRVFEFALGGTWLLYSPLFAAVFVQRMYLVEARTTGADLLTALRRPIIHAASGLVIALLCCTPNARADVPPQDLEKNIRQVLTERQYSWHNRVERVTDAQPDLLDRVVEGMRSTLRTINNAIKWMGDWLRQLFDKDSAEPANDRSSPAPKSVRFTMLALTVAIASALILFLLRRDRGKTSVDEPDVSPFAPNLEDEALQALALPEESWLALAQDLIARSEYRLALRALYLAMLAHLGSRELLALETAKTNRDYTRELRRRIADDRLNALFRANIRAFEASWYGKHPAGEMNLVAFQQNFDAMRAYGN